MKRLTITLATLGSMLPFAASGQVRLIERIEMDMKEVDAISVYAFEDLEMAIILSIPEDAKSYQRTLRLVDDNLKDVEKVTITSGIKPKEASSRILLTRNAFYVTVYASKKGTLEIHKVSIPSMEATKRLVVLPKKTSINGALVLGDKLYTMLGSSKQPKGKRSFIGIIDINTGKVDLKFTDGFAGTDSDLFEMEYSTGIDTQVIFHVSNSNRRDYKYYILRYDRDGQQVGKPWNLSNFKNNVTSASVTQTGDGDYVILGEYAQKSASAAEGMFFARVAEDGKASDVKYFNFIEIPHFLDYLPEKKAERIERKAERKEDKGKELSFEFRTVTHSIIRHEGELILLAEFYYPTYRTETYTTIVNGKTVTQTRVVFDGYQYTHALLAGMDSTGEMLWSNIFEIDIGYKPFSAIRVVKAKVVDDQIRLFNMRGSRLVAATYENGKIVDEVERELIETGQSTDRIKYSTGSQVTHWYDEVFLVKGFQKIKGDDKRKVYHVTAIEF